MVYFKDILILNMCCIFFCSCPSSSITDEYDTQANSPQIEEVSELPQCPLDIKYIIDRRNTDSTIDMEFDLINLTDLKIVEIKMTTHFSKMPVLSISYEDLHTGMSSDTTWAVQIGPGSQKRFEFTPAMTKGWGNYHIFRIHQVRFENDSVADYGWCL